MAKATTTKTTFSRSTRITTSIAAPVQVVWDLLVDAANYPKWNSTVIAIEGTIALGEKIIFKSTLAPERSFKLKVKTMEPPHTLVWGDAMGSRTYQLASNQEGVTFSMQERIGGLLFPLFAKHIPSFDENFEQFAADLKKEAERLAST